MGDTRLQGVKGGLQRVTKGDKGLQGVTGDDKGSLRVTGGDKELQKGNKG